MTRRARRRRGPRSAGGGIGTGGRGVRHRDRAFIGIGSSRRPGPDGRRVAGAWRGPDDAAARRLSPVPSPSAVDLSTPATLRAGAEGCRARLFTPRQPCRSWAPPAISSSARLRRDPACADACREAGVLRLFHVAPMRPRWPGSRFATSRDGGAAPVLQAAYCATKAIVRQCVAGATARASETVVVRRRLSGGWATERSPGAGRRGAAPAASAGSAAAAIVLRPRNVDNVVEGPRSSAVARARRRGRTSSPRRPPPVVVPRLHHRAFRDAGRSRSPPGPARSSWRPFGRGLGGVFRAAPCRAAASHAHGVLLSALEIARSTSSKAREGLATIPTGRSMTACPGCAPATPGSAGPPRDRAGTRRGSGAVGSRRVIAPGPVVWPQAGERVLFRPAALGHPCARRRPTEVPVEPEVVARRDDDVAQTHG